MLEGPHLIEEALLSGLAVEHVFCSASLLADGSKAPFLGRLEQKRVPLVPVEDALLQEFATTENTQGYLAIVAAPPCGWTVLSSRAPSSLIIADGIQDPGNLGSLARIAEGCGCGGLVTTRGTVDPANPKCLRASAGSLLRLPFVQGARSMEVIDWLRDRSFEVVIAATQAGLEPWKADLRPPFALVVGNESRGIGSDFKTAAGKLVTIPLRGKLESLNAAAAAGIILYEALARSAADLT